MRSTIAFQEGAVQGRLQEGHVQDGEFQESAVQGRLQGGPVMKATKRADKAQRQRKIRVLKAMK